jgi:EpsD family peptidyl-prolyl cis-trans isomerase
LNAKTKWTIFICCDMIALTSCREAAPRGQVVAIANGEEITIGELQAEAAARDLQNADSSAARSELLRTVLDRKLWAQEAKRAKLDRQIQHVLARRRAEERLLADLQVRALENAVEPPSDEDIKRYLHRNPAAFASQTIFKIDQINVQTDENTLTAEGLAQATSLDELDQILTRSGIVGRTGTVCSCRPAWSGELRRCPLERCSSTATATR